MWLAEELIAQGYDVTHEILLKKDMYDLLMNQSEEIIINVNASSTRISKKLLEFFISDEDYYRHLINAINNSGIIKIVLFENGSKNSQKDYTIVQVTMAINYLVKTKKLVLTEIETKNLSYLNLSIDLSKYLLKHGDDNYKISVDNKNIMIKNKDILAVILTLDNYKQFNEFTNYILTLSKTEFVYILKKFVNEKNIFKKFLFADDAINFYQNLIFYYDTEAINKLLISKTDFEYKINEQLIKDIQKKIPKNINLLEKTIYIYLNLSSYLKCDQEFDMIEEIKQGIKKHRDFTRISTINSKNNRVNYYEFNLIFLGLLNDINVNAEFNIYDDFITYRVDKYLIKSFSLSLTLKQKSNILNGLLLLNHNEKTKEEFNSYLLNIYEKLNQHNFEATINILKFEESLILYRENSPKIKASFKEKIDILLSLIANPKIYNQNDIDYIWQLKKILFNEDELNSNISFAIINESNKKFDSAVVIITYNLININLYNSNSYVYFNPPNDLKLFNLNELRLMFFNGNFKYIKGNKDVIIGIERSKVC